jgi:hypothetical protein
MRPIGFSTGALCHGDYKRALTWLEGLRCSAVELSALRYEELNALLGATPDSKFAIDAALLPTTSVLRRIEKETLPPPKFSRVSIHAPSKLPLEGEPTVAGRLSVVSCLGFDIVLHPDVIVNWDLWRTFGDRLLIENMDNRKPIGRFAIELATIFGRLPKASWCCDLGHLFRVTQDYFGVRSSAQQMASINDTLDAFAPRLREVHLSWVDARSKHHPLTCSPTWFVDLVATLAPKIPANVTIILEGEFGDLTKDALRAELREAHRILGDG